MSAAGLLAVAIAEPGEHRPNSYFSDHHRAAVAAAEGRSKGKLWEPRGGPGHLFDAAMAPYLGDPFRGAKERRVLAPGETPLDLEVRASRRALAAAGLTPADVDLAIVVSFHADQPDVGNAAFLAKELGIAAAFNLESACSGAVLALQTACALVKAGLHRRVLVAISCTYSRITDPATELAWFAGDGAGAFVVGEVPEGEGLLGAKTVATTETCGAFYWRCTGTDGEQARFQMQARSDAGALIREHSEHWLRSCCDGALAAAGLSLPDVSFFVFNTPTAWYGAFCRTVLGVPPERSVDCYPRTANIGPALTVNNLHQAASEGRLKRGDVVLLYSIGSIANASAALFRWGDVAVG